MVKTVTLDFDILNEYIEVKCGGKEYFLGGWSPEELKIKHNEIPEHIELIKGKNWFALRNGANQIDGVLNSANSEADPQLVIFKGYLAEASLHSYSPEEQILAYWSKDPKRRHNGVFSAVTISADGSELSLISDIFGMGQLYHRQEGDLVLFASAPGLLSMPNDNPNKISWILRCYYNYVPGKQTLVEQIETIIPGSIKRFSKDGEENIRWYDHKDFPHRTKVLDKEAMQESEQVFSKAIERCAALEHGTHFLPFTSGFDSRRILAHFFDQNIDFEATTVRMPEPTGEDVDAAFSEIISKDYDFEHTILEMPNADQWSMDEKQKVFSFDAQTSSHTWSVDFFRHFKGKHGCFYDGIGGDNFANWAWGFDVETVDNHPKKLPFFLNTKNFPSLELVFWRIKEVEMPESYGDNRAIITYTLMATKNRTNMWGQQQIHPGQIMLCPYFDLDYIEAMLKYTVDEYEDKYPQQTILAKFFPKLARYPNSRDFEEDIIIKEVPEGMNNIGDERKVMQTKADVDLLNESLKNNDRPFSYNEFLNFPARTALKLAPYITAIRNRIDWWLQPVSHIMLWWQSRPYIIFIDEDKK